MFTAGDAGGAIGAAFWKWHALQSHNTERAEIARQAVADWFEEDDDVPFMMQVFQIRPEKRSQIPAVTHVDGSGRLQTVDNDSNPGYFKLIHYVGKRTGVPMVLNTSFNENEPVVCRPEEALDCFLRTKMNVLVFGNHVIHREMS